MARTRWVAAGPLLAGALALAACGAGGGPAADPCLGVTCSGHGTCAATGGQASCRCEVGFLRTTLTTCEAVALPTLAGCQLFPADHLFNTPIDDLPVHPSSADFLASIGAANLHLDLGTDTDMASDAYYGIPWNVVAGDTLAWRTARYRSPVAGYTWDPRAESDCAVGPARTVASPCTAAAAPAPLLPIPASPLVEGGLATGSPPPDGDHHLLVVDGDACRLWELYHVFPDGAGGWDIYGSATWDLASNALRPDGWTSADAAGFPILPLLLRADEASSGAIRHALRFTIPTTRIRTSYTWPARHLTGNGTGSASLPEMGQPFRLKASYAIPAGFTTQAKAILQALKTYGMYVADGGSGWYVTGDPSARWQGATFTQVQSVGSDQFEAVDLGPIRARSGWSPDSARVPPP
jgi:hypothetical protein